MLRPPLRTIHTLDTTPQRVTPSALPTRLSAYLPATHEVAAENTGAQARRSAFQAARKIGVPDALVREQLNLMDGIRRARGLPRPTLSYHATDVPDIFIGMALEARVPVDAATAFAMNVELAAQMQRQGIDPHPRFAVLFSRFEA